VIPQSLDQTHVPNDIKVLDFLTGNVSAIIILLWACFKWYSTHITMSWFAGLFIPLDNVLWFLFQWHSRRTIWNQI